MRPVDEHEASPDLPIIDRSFPWLTSLQLQYCERELTCGRTWVVDHLTNGRNLGTDCTDLPFVPSSQLNRLQRMRFNMAVEALQLRKQMLLIVNGTTGTGKRSLLQQYLVSSLEKSRPFGLHCERCPSHSR